MKAVTARRAQAEIIGTLILIAASALMTTLMLFWGLSLQGQSNTNYGQAIARTNAQAAEQISIDNVLFSKVSTNCDGSYCYNATIYVRNFGDQPIHLAGVNIQVLASGVSPPSLHCEVTTSLSKATPLVIVARSVTQKTSQAPFQPAVVIHDYTGTAPSNNINGATWCFASNWTVNSQYLPSAWNGQTVSIQVATSAGTQFSNNYAVPP